MAAVYSPRQLPVSGNMVYTEYPVPAVLAEWVHCFWQLSGTSPAGGGGTYHVIPDCCIDIIINVDDPDDAVVVGSTTGPLRFDFISGFNYVGCRFLPGAFPAMFNISAAELSERTELLKNVLCDAGIELQQGLDRINNTNVRVASHVSEYFQFSKFADRQSDLTYQSCAQRAELNLSGMIIGKQMIRFLSEYLSRIVIRYEQRRDERFLEAMDKIIGAQGNLKMNAAKFTGISPRQLRRLFDFYIGESPKSFSRVVRFQSLLGLATSRQQLRQSRLYYDFGYVDQAHFIHDFQSLSGFPPSKLLSDGV
jgi:AraC-like DNA-binding protein